MNFGTFDGEGAGGALGGRAGVAGHHPQVVLGDPLPVQHSGGGDEPTGAVDEEIHAGHPHLHAVRHPPVGALIQVNGHHLGGEDRGKGECGEQGVPYINPKPWRCQLEKKGPRGTTGSKGWDAPTWKTEVPAGSPSAISAAKGRFWKVGSLSFRSSRLTNTVALLVARRGGRPPAGERGRGQGQCLLPENKVPTQGELPGGRQDPVLLAARMGQCSANMGRGRLKVKHDPLLFKTSWRHGKRMQQAAALPSSSRNSLYFLLVPRSEPGIHVPGPKDIWLCPCPQHPCPHAPASLQSVTDTTILRISSASCGLGFSRSSSTPEVRILPLVLLRL